MGYELVVVWDDGSRDVWDYDTWYESRRKELHYVEKRLGQKNM